MLKIIWIFLKRRLLICITQGDKVKDLNSEYGIFEVIIFK